MAWWVASSSENVTGEALAGHRVPKRPTGPRRDNGCDLADMLALVGFGIDFDHARRLTRR